MTINRLHGFSTGIAALFLLLASFPPPVADADTPKAGTEIAVFGNAVAHDAPPAGWQFLWNERSAIGDSSGYTPLIYDAASKMYRAADGARATPTGGPSSNHYQSIVAGRDSDGDARFFIAGYTLQDDASGVVWLNHGNFLNKSIATGVAVHVYLNDQLKRELTVPKDRVPALFQVELGSLKRGDRVHIAVGPPPSGEKAGGKLHFTLLDLPPGQQPAAPVNILSPAIDEAVPQRGPNGDINSHYLAQHKAQCERAMDQQSRLVFLGDSITSRWPEELLEKHFGAYRPVKMGGPGDWFQNVVWRVENGVFDRLQPEGVVLLIGTNNLSNGFSPDEVVQGTARIIRALREKSPRTRVLVQGILPRGGSINEPINALVNQTNTGLAGLADDETIFYLDVGPQLIEADGTIAPDVMPDKLHVAEPGYLRWLTVLTPAVEKMMQHPRAD